MTEMIRWFHAVNDRDKLQAVLRAVAEGDPDETVGVECDLRCHPNDPDPARVGVVFLSHDPIVDDTPGAPQRLTAMELVANIVGTLASATDGVSATCVVKLDFKTDVAIQAFSQQLRSDATLFAAITSLARRLVLWGNADLVVCRDTDRAAFGAAFPNPVASCVALQALSNVVSLGFHRPASATAPYGNHDVDALRQFVESVQVAIAAGGHELGGSEAKPAVGVTLALRLSTARSGGAESADAVRAMLACVAPLVVGTQRTKIRPFVTFWRGREETIEAADVEWVLNDLGIPATIDFE